MRGAGPVVDVAGVDDQPCREIEHLPREMEVLDALCRGRTNLEIAATLDISPFTVKNHVQKILRKLNVVNRTQAIGKSLELRILNL